MAGLWAAGDIEGALREYDEAKDYKNKAACELRLGKFEDAVASTTKALEEEQSVVALYRRAVAYRKLKLFEDAYDDLRTAMALEDGSVLRAELGELQRAYLASIDDTQRLEEISKKHGFENLDQWVNEPFYAVGPKTEGEPCPFVLQNEVAVVNEGDLGPCYTDVKIKGYTFRIVGSKVRCVSLIGHTMFTQDHARRATLDFYDHWRGDPQSTLEAVLHTGFTRQHLERQAVIQAFRKYSTFPLLYDDPEAAVRDGVVRTFEFEKVNEGVYAFDLFTMDFVKKFVAEIDAFYASGLPAHRPNSMNNYGVIVNDIGLEDFITTLQRRVLEPVAKKLFNFGGFDSHHSFIVKYRSDEDTHLDVHTDDSDVTFNIALGRDFEGSNLIFCGMIGTTHHRQFQCSYKHKIGRCVVHLGNRRHGTDDITRGERINLIVWNHSLAYRDSAAATAHNRDFHKEQVKPDPRCVSYTHDRDFGIYKDYPKDREQFRGRGWCPPKGAEYPGFQTDY